MRGIDRRKTTIRSSFRCRRNRHADGSTPAAYNRLRAMGPVQALATALPPGEVVKTADQRVILPGVPWSHYEVLLALLLEVYALAKALPLNGYGSWTLRSAPRERGAEPDECYVLGEARDKDRPDLAIEVVWTSGSLDK